MPSTLVCGGCQKTFIYPAKLSKWEPSKTVNVGDEDTTSQVSDCTELSVCPFCKSPDIIVQEETAKQETVANVYIYELTSGAQTELDGLLARGYRIVNRYSKQYHLEKLKEEIEQ